MVVSTDTVTRVNRAQKAYQQQINAREATQRANTEKIERLRQAGRAAIETLEHYHGFLGRLEHSAKNIETNSFRGDCRKDYENQVDRLTQEIKKQKSRHERNLEAITAKVGQLEIENSAAADVISGIQASISALAAGLA